MSILHAFASMRRAARQPWVSSLVLRSYCLSPQRSLRMQQKDMYVNVRLSSRILESFVVNRDYYRRLTVLYGRGTAALHRPKYYCHCCFFGTATHDSSVHDSSHRTPQVQDVCPLPIRNGKKWPVPQLILICPIQCTRSKF